MEADQMAKVFMAKWDIKDGFWRMDCTDGEEWNFANVLPQPAGEPILLVVPTSLQTGWVDSSLYFCAATEMARDVSTKYIDMPVGMLPPNKLKKVVGDINCTALPKRSTPTTGFLYMVEVYVDNFMSLFIPVSLEQL